MTRAKSNKKRRTRRRKAPPRPKAPPPAKALENPAAPNVTEASQADPPEVAPPSPDIAPEATQPEPPVVVVEAPSEAPSPAPTPVAAPAPVAPPAPVAAPAPVAPPAPVAAPAPVAPPASETSPAPEPPAAPVSAEAASSEPPAAAPLPGACPQREGAGKTHCLKAEAISKSYDGKPVVKEVSLSVAPGEVVGLLGPNGAGKTTTFYMMVGLIPPNGGRILLNRRDVTQEPMYRRARAGISYLPQEPSVFRKLTVRDNILAVLETLDLEPEDRLERLEELMGDLGVSKLFRTKGYALSGGERRRVEVARALAIEPQFILLDEPFAGVDPLAVGEIQSIIVHLKKRGIGILITDHNVRETLGICDRAYILTGGRILAEGPPQEIVDDPQVQKLYLGEGFRL